MKSHCKIILFLILIIVALYGCATLVGGTNQQMTFQSEPEGATVKVDGRPLGKTPITITIDKKADQTLSFELVGYKTVSMPLSTTVEPWFFGNILTGGLIGSTTDALSGAIYKYGPDQYYVTLVPVDGKISSKSKTKDFIVAGYKNIIDELNYEKGEYIESLLVLLGVSEDKKEDAIKKIRGLSLAYSEIPVFAEKVVEEFE
ncbi:MAG: PEGA domain-containing protein [Desulfuromonadales bacterium]|nr:PEGA domain-containing protein [Desulfuromonadales bacterium]MDW7758723.1 PEGA domain-containing protein [Desulfuromonadales bacterium]